MPAKVIVKSGYIKNVRHMQNSLDYAGNKIEAQLAVLTDGAAARNEEVLVWEGGEKQFDSAEYLKYIAYRPSVEVAPGKKHGLFNLVGDADIDMEKQKLLLCKDCLLWSHIVSLDREDAARTGYDCRAAWQNLIIAKSAEIAKLYNIDPKNLQLNAAYHDKDNHPHIHLFFYGTHPREGIVRDMKTASEKLKSLFFNEIFRDDVSYLKATHYDRRSQLEERLRGMLRDINRQSYRPPQEVCDKLLALSVSLHDVKGKLAYAYQKPEVKQKVDELVRLMVERDPHLREIFGAYRETQREFVEQYSEETAKIEKRMAEFEANFFHPRAAERGKPGSGDRAVLHNEVLRFAATLSDAAFAPPAYDTPAGATAQKEIELTQELASAPIPVNLPTSGEASRGELFPRPLATHQKRSPLHQKQTVRSKARYTAQLLMRAGARQLAAMARENDSYNDREGDGKSNITKWNNLKEPYHNFTEREPINF